MPKNAINHSMFALLTRELIGGASCSRMADVSGLHVATVRLFAKVMHSSGTTFICGWLPDANGAYTVRVYRLKLTAYEKDVPPPVTEATLARRLRKLRSIQHQASRGIVRAAEQSNAEPHRPAAPGRHA